MSIKEDLVIDVLKKLRALANQEAEFLFNEWKKNPGVSLPDYSQAISQAINRTTDAVVAALREDIDIIDSVTRQRLIEEWLPSKLVEVARNRLGDLPKAYTIAIIGSSL